MWLPHQGIDLRKRRGISTLIKNGITPEPIREGRKLSYGNKKNKPKNWHNRTYRFLLPASATPTMERGHQKEEEKGRYR